MDASFKQYTFEDGMDLQTAVPLDAQALLAAAQQGAHSNEAEGWVQNLNSAAIQNQLQKYQNQLEKYIQSQNGGNSTVGDVQGNRAMQRLAHGINFMYLHQFSDRLAACFLTHAPTLPISPIRAARRATNYTSCKTS